MTHLMLRLTAFAAAALCLGGAWQIHQVTAVGIVFRSMLAFTAFVLCTLLAIAFAWTAFAPARFWRAGSRMATQAAVALQIPPRPLPRGVCWSLIGTGLAAYVLLIAWYLPRQPSPIGNDQEAYLRDARAVQASGGVSAVPGRLLKGQFPGANRHPLYIAMLSLSPTYEHGKLLSATIGGVTLIVLTWQIYRRFDGGTAGIFAVLFSTNAALLEGASLVACESLLVLWAGLAWTSLIQHTDPSSPSDSAAGLLPYRRRQYVQAGVWLGLAWFTKGTGLLLAVGYVLWNLVRPVQLGHAANAQKLSRPTAGLVRRLRASTGPLFWMFVSWLIVSGPLLIRNVRRFGHPFYNINSFYLFMDRFIPPENLRPGVTVVQLAVHYVETHSFGEMALRAVNGLVWEAFIICRSLGPAPLEDSRVIFGAALLMLAGCGMLGQRRQDAVLVIIWCLLFWIMFAWYLPIAASDRFVLPLLPPLLAYASHGILRVVGLLQQNGK